MTRKFFSFISYAIAFLLIVIALLATGASYLLKDLKHYTQLSLQLLEQKTGYRISIDDVNWSIAKGAGVRIDNIKIVDPGRRLLLFSCRKAHILTGLFPLVENRFVVSRVILDDPEIALSRDKSGTWSFFSLPSGHFENASADGDHFSVYFALKNLFIKNGRLVFDDQAQQVSSSLDHINAQIKIDRKTGKYIYTARAEQICKSTKGSIAFEGDISYDPGYTLAENISGSCTISLKSILMSDVLAYLQKHLPVQSASAFDGSISINLYPDAHARAVANISTANLALDIHSSTAALGPSILDLEIKSDAESFSIDRFALSLLKGIEIEGNALLKHPPDTPSSFNLSLHSNTFSMAPVLKILNKSDVIPPDYKKGLLKIQSGTAEVKSLQLSTKPGQPLSELIAQAEGELEAENLIVKISDRFPPAKLSAAKCTMQGGSITGTIEGSWLAGDNHTMHVELSPLSSAPCLKAAISSRIPAAALGGFTHLLFDNATGAQFPKFPSGSLLAQSTVSVCGTSSFAADVNLTGCSYEIAGVVHKPEGLQSSIKLACTDLLRSDHAAPVSFDFSLDNRLVMSGRFDTSSTPKAEGTFSISSLPIDSLLFPSLPAKIAIKGTVSGNGTFLLPPASSGAPPLQGNLAAKDFELVDNETKVSLLSASLEAEMHDTNTAIRTCTARFGKTFGSFHGNLSSLLPPQGRLSIHAGFFDIDDFVETVERLQYLCADSSSVQQTPPLAHKNPFLQTDLDMELTLDKLNFLRWDLDNGTCRYKYKDGAMLWDNLTITGGSGIIKGAVLFDFSSPSQRTLKIMPAQSDSDFLWLSPGLRKKQPIIGKINLSGEFSSTFGKKTDIASNMKGGFHARMTNGKIQKFTTMSKILALLNISRIIKLQAPDLLAKGMPFDSIESDFTMEHAVMKTDNLIMKSPAMNLSAVGSIDLIHENVDLIVGAQILHTIGRIIGTIPIAGDMVTGKGKSLTIGYFHVHGPYEDASVTPMPLKSLSGPVLNVFKTILDIPRELFSTEKHDNQTEMNPGQAP